MYPPALWTAIKRVLVVSLREGWDASNITTTLVAASATNAMPATIPEITNIGVMPDLHNTVPMFSLAPVFYDVGSHSHSVGVNSIPQRFTPALDAFRFTRHFYDLANATAFKTSDVQ